MAHGVNIARTIGKVFGKFLFTTFLALFIMMITVVQITEYDNLELLFSELIGEQFDVDATRAQQIYDELVTLCTGRDTIEVPLSESETITIDCNAVRETEAPEVGRTMTAGVFENIYYKQYDCGFVECLQTNQFLVIFSSKGHAFFRSVQISCLIGAALGAGILFVSLEGWSNRLKGFGMPLISIGIFGLLVPLIGNWLIGTLMSGMGIPSLQGVKFDITPLVSNIFSSIQTNLLIILIFGIILTAAGYVVAWRERKAEKKQEKLKQQKKK